MVNVFVNRQPVGSLFRADPVNRFTYGPGVSPSQAVSLLMPVSEGVYVAERPGSLHPVFDMSLPEGACVKPFLNSSPKPCPRWMTSPSSKLSDAP